METLWLYDQRDGLQPPPGLVWRGLQCCQIEQSACGTYISVVLQGWQGRLGSVDRHRPCDNIYVYHVVLYSTSGAMQEQAWFCTGVWWPKIQWSPSGHLCIAQLLGNDTESSADELCCQAYGDGLLQELFLQSAAFVWDPKTAEVLHSLSPDTSAALRVLGKGCSISPAWSPSCQHLLIIGQHPRDRDAANRQGWLLIADVGQGRIVGQSNITFTAVNFESLGRKVFWHPRSHGLILSYNVQVQDTAPFLQKGFALGSLPQRLTMHMAGFSADACYLVARSHKPRQSSDSDVLVGCTMEGLHIRLDQVQPLVPQEPCKVEYLGWLPDGADLFTIWAMEHRPALCHVLWQYSASYGAFVPQVYEQNAPIRYQPSCCQSQRFSPSGKLFMAVTSPSMQIINLVTGQQCWEAITQHTMLPQPAEFGLRGLSESDQHLIIALISVHGCPQD